MSNGKVMRTAFRLSISCTLFIFLAIIIIVYMILICSIIWTSLALKALGTKYDVDGNITLLVIAFAMLLFLFQR